MEELFTQFFNPSNQVYQVIVAAFLGLFIGLRAEPGVWKKPTKKKTSNITGIRTMTLLVILGTVSTFFEGIPYMSLVLFIGVLAFVLIAYGNGVFRLKRYGLTTEVSALLAYLVGVLIGFEYIMIAIILSIIVGASFAYKVHIRHFAGSLSLKEWSGTLQLLVISALILPLLPREPIDPFGVLVPFDIWILVIMLAALGFVGYFFGKYVGEEKSIVVTSFLGSLISSTVTTTSLARRSKISSCNMSLLLSGVMIAISVMQVRVIIEIIALSGTLSVPFIAPASAMLLVSMIFAAYYHMIAGRTKKHHTISTITKRSPFELVPALLFAGFFIVVLYAIYFAQQFFGDVGGYVTAFIASFADVDVIVFSTLLSFQKSLVSASFVANILAIAVIMNTVVKLLYISLFGTREFAMRSLVPLSTVVVVGIIAAILV